MKIISIILSSLMLLSVCSCRSSDTDGNDTAEKQEGISGTEPASTESDSDSETDSAETENESESASETETEADSRETESESESATESDSETETESRETENESESASETETKAETETESSAVGESTAESAETLTESTAATESATESTADAEQKLTFGRVLILGDSYSTYEGYIPAGYEAWYKKNGNNNDKNNVTSVEETWWYMLMEETDSELVLNNSYSGTTIGSIGYGGANNFATAYVSRARTKFKFDKDEQIDTIFVFGGTNDSWANTPVGEPQYSDWSRNDLKSTLPSFCCLLSELKEKFPNAKIINIVNNGLKKEITDGMKEICEHYEVDCILLKGIAKQSGHPDILGMKQIKKQIIAFYD